MKYAQFSGLKLTGSPGDPGGPSAPLAPCTTEGECDATRISRVLAKELLPFVQFYREHLADLLLLVGPVLLLLLLMLFVVVKLNVVCCCCCCFC